MRPSTVDRQLSALLYSCLGGIVLAAVLLLGACDRSEGTSAPGYTSEGTGGMVRPYTPSPSELPVVVDPDTSCQYLGYTGNGLTPRLVWDESRKEMMTMGCRIVETYVPEE